MICQFSIINLTADAEYAKDFISFGLPLRRRQTENILPSGQHK